MLGDLGLPEQLTTTLEQVSVPAWLMAIIGNGEFFTAVSDILAPWTYGAAVAALVGAVRPPSARTRNPTS